jgi:hypothetical protein
MAWKKERDRLGKAALQARYLALAYVNAGISDRSPTEIVRLPHAGEAAESRAQRY